MLLHGSLPVTPPIETLSDSTGSSSHGSVTDKHSFSDDTHSHHGNKLAEASTDAAIAEDRPLSSITLNLGMCANTPD